MMLIRQFGELGVKLHRLSHGIDHSQVQALYPFTTIIGEHTFGYGEDEFSEPDDIAPYLLRICDQLTSTLKKRSERAGMITVRMELHRLPTVSRSYTLKTTTSSAHDIYFAADKILRLEIHGAKIKSIRLTLSDLKPGNCIQLSFLGDAERKMKLDAVVDSVRSRFGEHAIVYGWAS
jgi:DNA polymerase-4